ncbi:MAG: hypothetical protein ACRELA_05220 [Candidatus Rokuibacteriota bacterium]
MESLMLFDPWAPMAVPIFFGVARGLFFTFAGGIALLVVAAWWSWASDGISLARERWPTSVRMLALLGWGCFVGGVLGQVLALFRHVGVASW